MNVLIICCNLLCWLSLHLILHSIDGKEPRWSYNWVGSQIEQQRSWLKMYWKGGLRCDENSKCLGLFRCWVVRPIYIRLKQETEGTRLDQIWAAARISGMAESVFETFSSRVLLSDDWREQKNVLWRLDCTSNNEKSVGTSGCRLHTLEYGLLGFIRKEGLSNDGDVEPNEKFIDGS